MNELKNYSFLRIAFALFVVSAMAIPSATAVWEGSNEPLPGMEIPKSPGSGINDHSNDGDSWASMTSSGRSAADDIVDSFKKDMAAYKPNPNPTGTAADRVLENQGIVPIFESHLGKIYQRKVHDITIYGPDGNFFPIGYGAAYKNYFFYGNIDDFRKYIVGNAWYIDVMRPYLSRIAESTPSETNTRFVVNATLINSSQINQNYGGYYGDWLFASLY